tara:strand:- start:1714 stop:2952 length:1239 start_codon:yes stop_codon:yes gene_type:complete
MTIVQQLKNYRALIIAAVLLIIIIARVQPQITRLYGTVTLFDSDKIVHNFSHMDEIYRTVEVKPTGTPSQFTYHNKDKPNDMSQLPTSFVHEGVTLTLKEYLNQTKTTSFLVLDQDKIIFEDYYQGTKATDRRIAWSVSKSFVSSLLGIAMDDGYQLDLRSPITSYVPQLKKSGYNKVPIHDILEMSSGVLFNEDYDDFSSDINRFGRAIALGASMDEFAISLKKDKPSGKRVHYVSLDTHVLGMLIRAITGKPFVEYFDEKIWSKLKTEDSAVFIVDDYDEAIVLGGLNMRTRDFARFGRMVARDGFVENTEVVPQSWIKDSTTWHSRHTKPGYNGSDNEPFGYGFQWWIPADPEQECIAIGIYGQYIYINKKEKIVIVKTSSNTYFSKNHVKSKLLSISAFRAIVKHLRS